MERFSLVAASVVLVLSAVAASAQQPVPSGDAVYARFMELSVEQRRSGFAELSPEHRALIVRTHAERWLAQNRERLSASEIGLFEELIAFVTPERYGAGSRTAPNKGEQAMLAKIICRANPNDVETAFGVLRVPPSSTQPERWTYLDRARCWIRVAAEELADYVPLVRR